MAKLNLKEILIKCENVRDFQDRITEPTQESRLETYEIVTKLPLGFTHAHSVYLKNEDSSLIVVSRKGLFKEEYVGKECRLEVDRPHIGNYVTLLKNIEPI